jgi:hypothetical protein
MQPAYAATPLRSNRCFTTYRQGVFSSSHSAQLPVQQGVVSAAKVSIPTRHDAILPLLTHLTNNTRATTKCKTGFKIHRPAARRLTTDGFLQRLLTKVTRSANSPRTPALQDRVTPVNTERSVYRSGPGGILAGAFEHRSATLPSLSPSWSGILSNAVHVRVCPVKQFVSRDRG